MLQEHTCWAKGHVAVNFDGHRKPVDTFNAQQTGVVHSHSLRSIPTQCEERAQHDLFEIDLCASDRKLLYHRLGFNRQLKKLMT